ncbi:MAG: hypothetical protein R3324_20040, partial [Halobacteriales archaeon]|nr:hypothetical protein [Halobacteriales archaeon]
MTVALFGPITACDDRGASTGPPDAPVLGSVVASVDVSGTGRDRDGFTVNLGDDQSRALSADVEVTFSSIEAGTYTITLSGVAGNCVSTSSSSQTVTVEAGATVDVVFEVECGHLVYVGRQFDRTVSVISTLNNGHVAEIDMNGRYVGDLAVSTDGALLFVSHTSDNTVSIV